MHQTIKPLAARRRFSWKWIAYPLAVPACALLLYVLAVLVLPRIPVNSGFRSAPGGVPVVITDNGIHVDFLLPIVAADHDWRRVFDPRATRIGAGLGSATTYIVIGWGHRNFYLNTPTWDDLTANTIVRAVFGIGGTVMHVSFESVSFDTESSILLMLSPENYQRLVDAIVATTVVDERGLAKPVDAPGYSDFDAFYEAVGSYNALYTCNNWAASVLAAAGVRAPLWSPFSGAIMNQLRAATPN